MEGFKPVPEQIIASAAILRHSEEIGDPQLAQDHLLNLQSMGIDIGRILHMPEEEFHALVEGIIEEGNIFSYDG